jgi:hypothetical protein
VSTRFVGPAAAALACLLFVVALQLQSAPLSPQSLANRRFAATADYTVALSELKRVWPPLYPSVLWGVGRLGVPAHTINALLFLVTVVLLYPVGRRVAPAVDPAWTVALYAAATFNAFNLNQLVAEALLIPLALGILAATARCLDGGRVRDHVLLCALLAAACLTRYFALAWLAPLVGLSLARYGMRPLRKRILRAAAVVGVACAPAALWMLHARATTGFLTGMERFSPRGFSAQTSPIGNLAYTARTLFADFFAPDLDASHAALAAGSESPLGIAIAVTALGLGIWCARAVLRARRRAGPRTRDAQTLLLTGLSIGYVAVLLLVWTVGNNDPIYSRFLYPCYVFFLLGGMHLYSLVKMEPQLVKMESQAAHARSHGDSLGGQSRPFHALYALLLVSQALGTLLSIGAAR